MHFKKLHAVGLEKLQTEGTEKRHGVTETCKALPRKDIFRTLSVVERNASKQNLEERSPDNLRESLSFSTKEHLKALTILPYAK